MEDDAEQWISISDMMSGLMMLFLLIAVSFMVKIETEKQKIEDVAVLYDRLRTQLYQDLFTEFARDLPRWGATITPDLVVRFNDTSTLFDKGDDRIKAKFKRTLSEFFPRYLRIMMSENYRRDIAEIRIEGHTSSGWAGALTADDAYIKNMALSQARTRSTLSYVLNLTDKPNRKWLIDHLTANGLSSSQIISDRQGSENEGLSRRVEFRVRTDAESRIASIIQGVASATP